MIRKCAEVPYVPGRQYERRDSQPYRYLAIRVRRQQGKLLENGAKVHHFAVVTNIWDMGGQELLEWQRGKAGTIEHIHHILDNELAAGVCPGAKHGANAAWLRLQVLTHKPTSATQSGSSAPGICHCTTQEAGVCPLHPVRASDKPC